MDFKTEENDEIGFNFKKLIPFVILIVVLIIIIIIIVSVSKGSSNKKKQQNQANSTENKVVLNSELDGAYAIAKEDNYIVILKENGDAKRIYNLTQGTGNLGDFHDYAYYDKKIYMLFGDKNIYSLSLTDGNGIYELKKEYEYTPISCKDGKKGYTTNIEVTEDIIYINNSSCAISGFNYTKDGFDEQVNVYQFDKLTTSSMVYSDGVLLFQGNDSIYALSEEDGKINKIIDKASGDMPIELIDDVLLYTTKVDNSYNYFGYNISTGANGALVEKAKKLIIYNEGYIYYDNGGVYISDGEEVTKIYELRYNQLSNLELIDDDILQIVDKSTNGNNKLRISNIDLKNKNKRTTVRHIYSKIEEIK